MKGRGGALRALLPEPADLVDLVETYASGIPGGGDRPFVRVNMISSLDGAIAVAGRSAGLGGGGDRLLFHVLRSLCDVVLVGAGTARVERYRQVHVPPEVQEVRRSRGQAPVPPVAVVTQSCNLDWSSELFRGPGPRTIVLAPGNTPADALQQARVVADVMTVGAGAVDLTAAVASLHDMGLAHVLCEGGPTLNTSLAAANLVDELCLTLSPQLAGCVGGVLLGGWLGSTGVWMARTEADGTRNFRSQPLAQLVPLRLVSLLEDESYLFLRLAAARPPQG